MDNRQNLPNQMYITLLISLHLTELTFKFYSLESRLHFYQLLKKFIYFTTIDIQVLQLKSISLMALMLVPGGHWCGEKQEFPERKHVSK